MSTKPSQPDAFASIDPSALENVAGGARSSDAQLTATLNSITSSIADLAKGNQNQMDPMMMMMMVMMMGGGGGGGGYVAAPAAGPPVINVDTSVAGGGRRWGFGGFPGFGGGCGKKGGKKGW
jgi:hypothetical protein